MDDSMETASPFSVESGCELRFEVPATLYNPAEFLHVEGTLRCSGMEYGPDAYAFPNPISWQADVTNTGDALLVSGTVAAEAHTECARCLEDAVFPVEGEIEGYFLIGGADAPEGMDEDEFDRLPENGVLDFDPLIAAAVLVELPLVPLCSEDCKGLCATCGANLNEGACACAPSAEEDEFELARNPFAALKGLKLD